MKKEIWKDAVGYEGLYQVSNLGRIYSFRYNKILNPPVDKHNCYIQTSLWKNKIQLNCRVHRLIAETFIPDKTTFKSMPDEDRSLINLDELEVNHKDEDKTNNCVDNLEWCTKKYNIHYGTSLTRRAHSQSKPIEQFDLNGNFIKKWNSTAEASRNFKNQYKNPKNNINDVLRGRHKTACGYIWRYAKK